MLSGFVLVGVFAAGTVFGAGLMHWTQTEHVWLPPRPGGPQEAMRQELALDDAQVAQLQTILDAHRPQLEAIMRATQQNVRGVLDAIEADMRPHLRPDQIRRLEEWKKRRPPPPMPGFPGMRPPPGMGPPPRP